MKEETMWNKPTGKRLAKMPKLYATDEVSIEKKLIYLHFSSVAAIGMLPSLMETTRSLAS